MTKLLILFFGVAIMNLQADSTNIYEEIVKRNAFNLTEEKPTKILPPITDILRGEVFLTGIHSINNVKRVSLVVREKGNDKFVSLLKNQGTNGIYIKSIGSTNVLASVFGTHKLLSFEKHGLPTTITKAPPKLLQRSDKKSDNIDQNERRRQYDEWRKRNK
jgi:type II secretory pathway component PulC